MFYEFIRTVLLLLNEVRDSMPLDTQIYISDYRWLGTTAGMKTFFPIGLPK
jgi:hypothetical protein